MSQSSSPRCWVRCSPLIYKVSKAVGYDFDVAQLKAEFYAPQGHRTADDELSAIRAGLAKIMKGEAGLRVQPVAPQDGAGH
jgi:hypothetical protein